MEGNPMFIPTEITEFNAYLKTILDAIPLTCTFFNEDCQIIGCNQEMLNLFEVSSREEYIENFFIFSPMYQPDGMPSVQRAFDYIKLAFEKGRMHFEWMHQKTNGELIPAEVTLVRIEHKDKKIVCGFVRDLRELQNTITLLNHLEQLAFTDSLTEIYNRRHFMEIATKEFAQYSYKKKPISIIMFDLDEFKNVNDTYGHMAGDFVLKSVAQKIKGIIRTTDFVARYGGEEFIVFAKINEKSAIKLANRIRKSIAESIFEYNETSIHVTISVGVATKSDDVIDFEETLQLADQALYRAKNNGRNRVEY